MLVLLSTDYNSHLPYTGGSTLGPFSPLQLVLFGVLLCLIGVAGIAARGAR